MSDRPAIGLPVSFLSDTEVELINALNRVDELERERDEARNKMADALQELDLRTLDFERMKQERDEAIEARKASAADWLNQIENANARVSAAKRERDEYQDRLRIALGERDSWRMRSEQKYAMRSELEELLGVTPADASDEQFEKGLAALKSIIRERDEARAAIVGWENKWKCAIDMAARAQIERDDAIEERDLARKQIIMTYEQLEERILEWSAARGIIQNGKANSQLLKAISEMGELADAHAKNQPEEIKDAIGDIIVCLINYCALQDIKLLDCLDGAYNVIKHRKGYLTKEGVFIKE